MKALDFLAKKYKLDLTAPSPIEIPNVGRDNLASWLRELKFKKGVEVGVAEGEYAEILCKANPQMEISGIDPFAPYKGYRDYTKASTLNQFYKQAVKRLSKYPNYHIIRDLSVKALTKFTDNSVDFVYIDANHEEPYITQDIAGWSKKVKPGGIIAGHDYIRRRSVIPWDVKSAVQKYVKQHQIRPWFILGTRAKIPGMIRDKHRSWMWVKQ